MLETALQALDLANLDLYLPAQLLVLRGQILEVRRTLVRVLPKRNNKERVRRKTNSQTRNFHCTHM